MRAHLRTALGATAAFLICVTYTTATITPHFRDFIIRTFDNDTARIIAREDIAENASYGGFTNDSRPNKQPVIFVHGVMSTAAKFFPIKQHFEDNGYTESEIYGTTWGDPDQNLITITVDCSYVKQIRSLIQAVHNYTRRKLDVVGFSLGCIISRKAIYGGVCDGEDLGAPLTDYIDTFVSVAGPNKGSATCENFGNIDLCNSMNGVSCDSSLLYELNSEAKRYEGKNSFAIYSKIDEKIGDECCGEKCGSLVNSNREFGHFKMAHDYLLYATAQLQFDLVTKHRPMPRRPFINHTLPSNETDSMLNGTLLEGSVNLTASSALSNEHTILYLICGSLAIVLISVALIAVYFLRR